MSIPLRILIVDDCQDTARSLAMLVELWGHQVWTAHDGPSALAAAESCRPDVVLLDIGLPGVSGYDVARQLRRQQARRPPLLVAVTGYGLDQDRQRAHQAGFDLHLLKPVHPETLEQLLTAAGGRHGGAPAAGGDQPPPASGQPPPGRRSLPTTLYIRYGAAVLAGMGLSN